MLSWFKDANLTLPVTGATPKWVCIPLGGGLKTTSLYLGDAYTTLVAQPHTASEGTVILSQTDELPTSGTVTIAWASGVDTVTYTGVTASSITGCSGDTHAYTVGTVVYPQITYTAGGNISIYVSGMANGPILLSLAVPPSGAYGPVGAPALYSVSTIASGAAGALKVNLQFLANIGIQAEYTNLSLSETPVSRPQPWIQGSGAITIQVSGPIAIEQRDQGLTGRLRLLPANRQVQAELPGFIWGTYRWRDNTTENAVAIVPTKWDLNTSLITQDFIGGVGSTSETEDIQPIDLEESNSSIYMRTTHGAYWTGVNRYFFPSDDWNLEFLPCYPGLPFTYILQHPPKEQLPVFVGTYAQDSQGFYEFDLNARYTFGPNFQPNSTQPQFTVDHFTGLLTVNAAVQQPRQTLLIGVLSGFEIENFSLPIYPVDKIVNLYVGNPVTPITNFTFSQSNNTLSFPKVAGTSAQQPLYAVVDAAIAVLYEYDVDSTVTVTNTNEPDDTVLLKDTRLLSPDLNPAFAGLASGYVYIQHRLIEPVSVQLSCDKPQIAVPATLSSIIGLVAYGPVFYNGDYALLAALAIGSLPNEVVPGAQLQVIPGGLDPDTGHPLQATPFRGLINGLDPNTNTIIVTTGGDGIANLVYQPEPDFGYYIPTTSPWVTTTIVSDDTLLLPYPVPISQLWNINEGWISFLYSVLSNDPLFGLISGVPADGQLPFETNGEVSGDVTINASVWTPGISTFTLASAPTNLEVSQNINVVGCTETDLNGYQSVLSIYETSGTWYITATNTDATSGSESETATFNYSNFRSNGVLAIWAQPFLFWAPSTIYAVGNAVIDSNGNLQVCTTAGTSDSSAPAWSITVGATTSEAGPSTVTWINDGRAPMGNQTVPIYAYDSNGNNQFSGSFNGNVVSLQFSTSLPDPDPGYLQAYFLQYLEREIIQVQVVGTSILSNSIMLQMATPQQILSNPYLVLAINGLYPSWAPDTTYALNQEVEVTIGSNPPIGYIMKVTTIGANPVSDSSAPSWNATGTTSEAGPSTLIWTSQGVGTGYADAFEQSRMNINRLGITPNNGEGVNSTQQPS
ncbi:MAG: hypothetical protein WA766_11755 [Candidatus Acidiferrales bacterium]